jgi:hypothetical protein
MAGEVEHAAEAADQAIRAFCRFVRSGQQASGSSAGPLTNHRKPPLRCAGAVPSMIESSGFLAAHQGCGPIFDEIGARC